MPPRRSTRNTNKTKNEVNDDNNNNLNIDDQNTNTNENDNNPHILASLNDPTFQINPDQSNDMTDDFALEDDLAGELEDLFADEDGQALLQQNITKTNNELKSNPNATKRSLTAATNPTKYRLNAEYGELSGNNEQFNNNNNSTATTINTTANDPQNNNNNNKPVWNTIDVVALQPKSLPHDQMLAYVQQIEDSPDYLYALLRKKMHGELIESLWSFKQLRGGHLPFTWDGYVPNKHYAEQWYLIAEDLRDLYSKLIRFETKKKPIKVHNLQKKDQAVDTQEITEELSDIISGLPPHIARKYDNLKELTEILYLPPQDLFFFDKVFTEFCSRSMKSLENATNKRLLTNLRKNVQQLIAEYDYGAQSVTDVLQNYNCDVSLFTTALNLGDIVGFNILLSFLADYINLREETVVKLGCGSSDNEQDDNKGDGNDNGVVNKKTTSMNDDDDDDGVVHTAGNNNTNNNTNNDLTQPKQKSLPVSIIYYLIETKNYHLLPPLEALYTFNIITTFCKPYPVHPLYHISPFPLILGDLAAEIQKIHFHKLQQQQHQTNLSTSSNNNSDDLNIMHNYKQHLWFDTTGIVELYTTLMKQSTIFSFFLRFIKQFELYYHLYRISQAISYDSNDKGGQKSQVDCFLRDIDVMNHFCYENEFHHFVLLNQKELHSSPLWPTPAAGTYAFTHGSFYKQANTTTTATGRNTKNNKTTTTTDTEVTPQTTKGFDFRPKSLYTRFITFGPSADADDAFGRQLQLSNHIKQAGKKQEEPNKGNIMYSSSWKTYNPMPDPSEFQHPPMYNPIITKELPYMQYGYVEPTNDHWLVDILRLSNIHDALVIMKLLTFANEDRCNNVVLFADPLLTVQRQQEEQNNLHNKNIKKPHPNYIAESHRIIYHPGVHGEWSYWSVKAWESHLIELYVLITSCEFPSPYIILPALYYYLYLQYTPTRQLPRISGIESTQPYGTWEKHQDSELQIVQPPALTAATLKALPYSERMAITQKQMQQQQGNITNNNTTSNQKQQQQVEITKPKLLSNNNNKIQQLDEYIQTHKSPQIQHLQQYELSAEWTTAGYTLIGDHGMFKGWDIIRILNNLNDIVFNEYFAELLQLSFFVVLNPMLYQIELAPIYGTPVLEQDGDNNNNNDSNSNNLKVINRNENETNNNNDNSNNNNILVNSNNNNNNNNNTSQTSYPSPNQLKTQYYQQLKRELFHIFINMYTTTLSDTAKSLLLLKISKICNNINLFVEDENDIGLNDEYTKRACTFLATPTSSQDYAWDGAWSPIPTTCYDEDQDEDNEENTNRNNNNTNTFSKDFENRCKPYIISSYMIELQLWAWIGQLRFLPQVDLCQSLTTFMFSNDDNTTDNNDEDAKNQDDKNKNTSIINTESYSYTLCGRVDGEPVASVINFINTGVYTVNNGRIPWSKYVKTRGHVTPVGLFLTRFGASSVFGAIEKEKEKEKNNEKKNGGVNSLSYEHNVLMLLKQLYNDQYITGCGNDDLTLTTTTATNMNSMNDDDDDILIDGHNQQAKQQHNQQQIYDYTLWINPYCRVARYFFYNNQDGSKNKNKSENLSNQEKSQQGQHTQQHIQQPTMTIPLTFMINNIDIDRTIIPMPFYKYNTTITNNNNKTFNENMNNNNTNNNSKNNNGNTNPGLFGLSINSNNNYGYNNDIILNDDGQVLHYRDYYWDIETPQLLFGKQQQKEQQQQQQQQQEQINTSNNYINHKNHQLLLQYNSGNNNFQYSCHYNNNTKSNTNLLFKTYKNNLSFFQTLILPLLYACNVSKSIPDDCTLDGYGTVHSDYPLKINDIATKLVVTATIQQMSRVRYSSCLGKTINLNHNWIVNTKYNPTPQSTAPSWMTKPAESVAQERINRQDVIKKEQEKQENEKRTLSTQVQSIRMKQANIPLWCITELLYRNGLFQKYFFFFDLILNNKNDNDNNNDEHNNNIINYQYESNDSKILISDPTDNDGTMIPLSSTVINNIIVDQQQFNSSYCFLQFLFEFESLLFINIQHDTRQMFARKPVQVSTAPATTETTTTPAAAEKIETAITTNNDTPITSQQQQQYQYTLFDRLLQDNNTFTTTTNDNNTRNNSNNNNIGSNNNKQSQLWW